MRMGALIISQPSLCLCKRLARNRQMFADLPMSVDVKVVKILLLLACPRLHLVLLPLPCLPMVVVPPPLCATQVVLSSHLIVSLRHNLFYKRSPATEIVSIIRRWHCFFCSS